MTFLAADSWQIFIDTIQILLPAFVVFLVTYFTLKKMLDEDFKRKELELRNKRSNDLTPMKLQAYERLTILLERIRLDNLVMRLADPNLTATEFQHRLSSAIAEEFNHNVSQQIFISDQAWIMVKAAKEDALNTINKCYKDMSEFSKSPDLGKAILKDVIARKSDVVASAIRFLKKEIDLVF
jgi:hypothetical protein